MQVSVVVYFCLPAHPYDVSTVFLGSEWIFSQYLPLPSFVLLDFLLNFSPIDAGLCSLL